MSSENGTASVVYIPDGHTLSGTITATEVHGPLWIRYRPMLAEERRRVFGEMQRAGDRADHVAAEAIKAHLLKWDAKDERGQHLPIRPERIIRLQPNLLTKLFNVVAGIRPLDIGPRWDTQTEEAESKN